jgi:hypothetical protein
VAGSGISIRISAHAPNSVKYLDPDGLKIEYIAGEGVSQETVAEAKAMGERIKNSDTEAGRRYRMTDASDKVVTVKVNTSGGSDTNLGDNDEMNIIEKIKSAFGIGGDVFVNFNIASNILLGGGVPEDAESTLAHEIGHAYLMQKGRNFFFSKNRERDAVAIENQYRDSRNLRQVSSYHSLTTNIENVPQYRRSSGNFVLSGINKKYPLRK